jgi:hypothetical protein
VSIVRSDSPYSATRPGVRLVDVRRSVRSTRVATGTLACKSCDAPIAIAAPLTPAATLTCPFCDRRGPLRDFLSLAEPVRAARVVITVRACA